MYSRRGCQPVAKSGADLSLTGGNKGSPNATPACGRFDHNLVLMRSKVTDNGFFNVRDEHTGGIDG